MKSNNLVKKEFRWSYSPSLAERQVVAAIKKDLVQEDYDDAVNHLVSVLFIVIVCYIVTQLAVH